MYLQANINKETYIGTSIQVNEGICSITYKTTPNFYHALGGIHGSVYFKQLDDAAYFAASSMEATFFLLTKSFSIEFIRPVDSSLLHCEGRFTSKENEAYEAYAELFNEQNKIVAKGSGVFARSKSLLKDTAGYS